VVGALADQPIGEAGQLIDGVSEMVSTPWQRTAVCVILAIGLFTLASCESKPPEQPKSGSKPPAPQPGATATTSAPAPSPARTELLPEGAEAPDWSLSTPDGTAITLKSLRGKVVVLDFWAVWCVPCKKAMPGIQKLHEKFKDKPVVVYGIDTWEKGNNDPAGYMKKSGFTYGLLLKGETIAPAYGIQGIPVFYVIGTDGKVVYAAAGSDNEAPLGPAIEKALKQMGK
jgi:thiol-disulfide isomerase/thioredoxin